jgi:hypothetical protein
MEVQGQFHASSDLPLLKESSGPIGYVTGLKVTEKKILCPPLTVTVNATAVCLRTDCNILEDNKKKMSPPPFLGYEPMPSMLHAV